MIVYNALPRIARLLSLAIRMMEAMALGCLPSCAWSEFWAHSTWALRRLSPSCRPLRLHWSNMVGGSVGESVANNFFTYIAVQRMPSWQATGYVDWPQIPLLLRSNLTAFFTSVTNQLNNAPKFLWTLWTTRQVSLHCTTTSEQLFKF